jgi:WD40 repeat protein
MDTGQSAWMTGGFLLVDISVFRQDMQEKKKYRLLTSLEGHTSVIFRIAWSPNGDLIASPSIGDATVSDVVKGATKKLVKVGQPYSNV